MQTYNPASLYDRTIANGGGTFELHADNFNRQDVTSGYAVAIVDGTFATVAKDDRHGFNVAVATLVREYPIAQAIGTWLDTDTDLIHIDPVMVADDETLARNIATANRQLAYFNLNTMEEVRLDRRSQNLCPTCAGDVRACACAAHSGACGCEACEYGRTL